MKPVREKAIRLRAQAERPKKLGPIARARIREDVIRLAPALRTRLEDLAVAALVYDRAASGEGEELTALAAAANDFARAFSAEKVEADR